MHRRSLGRTTRHGALGTIREYGQSLQTRVVYRICVECQGNTGNPYKPELCVFWHLALHGEYGQSLQTRVECIISGASGQVHAVPRRVGGLAEHAWLCGHALRSGGVSTAYGTLRTPLLLSFPPWVGAPRMGCSRSTPQGVPEEACGGPSLPSSRPGGPSQAGHKAFETDQVSTPSCFGLASAPRASVGRSCRGFSLTACRTYNSGPPSVDGTRTTV